jgi:eukaryotic-like serine/threonine-protein kinase
MATSRDSWGWHSGDRITPELTVLRLLGGGSAYEAYLAFDDLTWSPVVVKVVRPAQVLREGTLRGLRREVATLESVRHPAVVRCLRAQLEGDRPHVVLENLDGPRLSTLIRRHGPLEPAQYLPLGIEVATAVHYFRRQGLVHLDIKPSNVIMGAPAKLIDLSVARPLDDAAALEQPVGTDAYMAPEQCDPPTSGRPGPPTDVWGLGATLFEAVAGHRPFEGVRLEDVAPADRLPQLSTSPRPLPDRTPAAVADVVRACLAADPADRPAPSDVADALGSVLERLPRGGLGGFKEALAR